MRRLVIRGRLHTTTLENLLHGIFPASREQLISLVKDGEPGVLASDDDVLEGLFDLLETTEREQVHVLRKVHESAWSGDEDITTHLQLLALILCRCTAIDDARTQHGTVADCGH